MDRLHKPALASPISRIILLSCFLVAVETSAATISKQINSPNAQTTTQAPQSSGEVKPSFPQRVVSAVGQRIRAVFRRTPVDPSTDTAPPTSRIDSPSPGSQLAVGTPVTIHGTAIDFGGGSVNAVEVSVDGGASWARAEGTSNWSITWTPATARTALIIARAIDSSGNAEAASAGLQVTTFASPGLEPAQLSGPELAGAKSFEAAAAATPAGHMTFVDTTATDFAAGTLGSDLAAVAQKGDGELILKPAFSTEFATLPVDWVKVEPGLAMGSVVAQNDQLKVENAYAYALPLFRRPRALEFRATFSGGNQRVGLGITFDTPAWARFSTNSTGTYLYAETSNGLDTPLSIRVDQPNVIGQSHVFKIEWTDTEVRYYVDDVQAGASHPVPIGVDLRPIVRDDLPDRQALTVDWMRMGPYPQSATFLSRVFNFGQIGRWSSVTWTESASGAPPCAVCLRVGKTPTPDSTWTNWICPAQNAPPRTLSTKRYGQYAQYRAVMTSSATATPDLLSVAADVDPACTFVEPGCVAASNPPCDVQHCDPTTAGDNGEDPICVSQNTDNTPCDVSFCSVGTCQNNACSATGPRTCVEVDLNPCTAPTCTEGVGCEEVPATGAACGSSASSTCSGPDTCSSSGTCNPNNRPTTTACEDDGNPCTADFCDGNGNCAHTPVTNGTSCSDNNACTTADSCQAGVCTGTAKTCAATDQCHTAGTCDVSTGACTNPQKANGTTCNADSNACTTDSCQNGTCTAGASKTCNDNNACTDDSCNPMTGDCVYKNDDTNTCNDGQFCTVGDHCSAGSCVGSPNTCSDGNACTPDTCNESTDTCSHGAVPQETCNGKDDDCDGKADEGFPPGKMTGGGQIDYIGQKITFGGNAKGTVWGKSKGEFNYLNHSNNTKLNGKVTRIYYTCSCEMRFRFKTKDNCSYDVTWRDGKPTNSSDAMGIEPSAGPQNAWCKPENTHGMQPVKNGNIECHGFKDHDEDDDDSGDCNYDRDHDDWNH